MLLLILCLPLLGSWQDEPATQPREFKAQNIVIVVTDGPRYTETWGDSTRQYIPNLRRLARKGVVYSDFQNKGRTYTNSGYTAMCTGHYQSINNTGMEYPNFPSIFQIWRKQTKALGDEVQIITSKDKLEVMGNTTNENWKDKLLPTTNCGNFGMGRGSGYRDDEATFASAKKAIREDKPRMLLIGFQDPDASGHGGNWDEYLAGIKKTDEYVGDIWKLLESDPFYKGKTAFFVTHDHGRHLDGHLDGFISHGDNCKGCRHILLYASGPDFLKDTVMQQPRELIDIPVTIGEIMGFDIPESNGQVLTELFTTDSVKAGE